MDVDCEGCAGCCVDWRGLVEAPLDHERRGRFEPLDDAYNLVFLTREEVRGFLDAGLGDALTPRLFAAEVGVSLGGTTLAAVEGRPVFCVGLRKPPKPVAPFDGEAAWLPACVFLDPETLQCRIHGDDRYPGDCADYPGQNLLFGAETECERVERHVGGERLLDDSVPEDLPGLHLGPDALGGKVYAYPDDLTADAHRPLTPAVVESVREGDLSAAWRARFVGVAAAGAPGTLSVDADRFAAAVEQVREADSWVGRAIVEWERRAASDAPDPSLGRDVEDDRGAPPTPGWEHT